MKIIKLNAIDSTNSFLKEMAIHQSLEDYTVVVTDHQEKGRGQMDTNWESEPYKNLTFSLFTTLKNLDIQHQSYLNFAISLAVYDALTDVHLTNLHIKWPNDIMAGDKKICGILIETTFTKNRIKNSIIGIGLNVNQEQFSESLSSVSSLKLELKKEFDLEELLLSIIQKIKFYVQKLEEHEFNWIYQSYSSFLYKKEIPMAFLNTKNDTYFMGIIKGVSTGGKLIIELEDESLTKFDSKEIAFAKSLQ